MTEESLAADALNSAALLCPRCDTLILRQEDGRWSSHEIRLPRTSVPPDGWPTPEDALETLSGFWAVDDMYSFANIAFSRTIGQHKYLCCPDCEFGPLGYHELQGDPLGGGEIGGNTSGKQVTSGNEHVVAAPRTVADDPESLAAAATPFFLADSRVVHATVGRPPKPTRTMDSAAAAAVGIDVSALTAEPQPESQDPEHLPPLVDEDPSVGDTIALTFAAPTLGLYLEDQPATESARAAGWPGTVESAIRGFNPVPPPDAAPTGSETPEEQLLIPGEAEASGQLRLGDIVLSIHGVDVRGIGTGDTVRLVMAAPRPFEMRFLRRHS